MKLFFKTHIDYINPNRENRKWTSGVTLFSLEVKAKAPSLHSEAFISDFSFGETLIKNCWADNPYVNEHDLFEKSRGYCPYLYCWYV